MIIGLNGLKGSGKDTVAAYLIKEHGFERRAFADSLKRSVAALFNIPFHKIDSYKNDSTRKVFLANDHIVHQGTEPFADEIAAELTFREFLQRYGTESHRDVFGNDFWVDHTLPTDSFYVGRKIVITDVRFDNEATRVNMLNGFVVVIERSGLDTTDQHSSEQPLSPHLIDSILLNNGSLDQLYERVEGMLVDLGGVDNRIRKVLDG